MTQTTEAPSMPSPVVLILDDDVIARSAIANYLRECGHQVIEASSEVDAKSMINTEQHDVDIVICATSDVRSAKRFEFSRWIREQHRRIRVLMAATVEKTAKLAADICEEGPHLRKPYEPQALIDWIKRLRT